MKTYSLMIAAACMMLAACASTSGTANNSSNRNFVVGIYQATFGQIQIAQQRASRFFRGLPPERKEKATEVRYLAVRTADPTPAQMVAIKKEIKKPRKKGSTGSYGAIATTSSSSANTPVPKVYCVMIWDTQTQEVVGEKCYAVLDLPQEGLVAKFDVYTAQYVGAL